MVDIRETAGRWELPVIQTCGHTTEAKTFREDVLSQPEGVHCLTCEAPVAPWAPRNHALAGPVQADVPAAWRDVIRPVPVAVDAVRNAALGVHKSDDQAIYDGYTAALQSLRDGPRFENILVKRSATSERMGHTRAALQDLTAACRLDPALRRKHGTTLDRLGDAATPPSSPRPGSRLGNLPEGFGECVLVPEQMYDPVSLSCGHTFERENLFKTGRPFFCAACQNPGVSWHIPNLDLRHILDDVASEPTRFRPRAGLRLSDGLPASAIDLQSVMASANRLVDAVMADVVEHGSNAVEPARLQAWLEKLEEAVASYPHAPAARFLRARLLATCGRATEACDSFAEGELGCRAAPYAEFVASLYEGCGLPAVLDYLKAVPADARHRAALSSVVLQRFETQVCKSEAQDALPELFAAACRFGRHNDVMRAAWEGIRAARITDLSRLCAAGDAALRRSLLEYVGVNGEYTDEAMRLDWTPERNSARTAWLKMQCHHLRKCDLKTAVTLMGGLLALVEDELSGAEQVIHDLDPSKPRAPKPRYMPKPKDIMESLLNDIDRPEQRKLVQQAASDLGLRLADQHMIEQAQDLYRGVEDFLPGAAQPLACWLTLVDLAERQAFALVSETEAAVREANRVRNDRRQHFGADWGPRLEAARDAMWRRYPDRSPLSNNKFYAPFIRTLRWFKS